MATISQYPDDLCGLDASRCGADLSCASGRSSVPYSYLTLFLPLSPPVHRLNPKNWNGRPIRGEVAIAFPADRLTSEAPSTELVICALQAAITTLNRGELP